MTTICNAMNYRYYGSIDKQNIVLFKNNYYTLGETVIDGYERRVLRKYNPFSCQWDPLTFPGQPSLPSSMDKLITEGNTMYIIGFDATAREMYRRLQPPM